MLYLISYDLKGGSSEDYAALYAEFASFDDHIKCLDSSWLIASDLDCSTIKDRVYAHMKRHDLVIVVPYDEPRSAILPTSVVQWIRKYLR